MLVRPSSAELVRVVRSPALGVTRLRPTRSLSTAAAERPVANEESSTVRRIGALIFSGLVGTTACLCSWQLKRYGWKLQLIEERKSALQLDPLPLRELCPELSAGIDSSSEYARVACEGVFDHAQQVLLGPRSAPPGSDKGAAPPGAPTQTGWDVITPLTLADGSRVIVNRGWVPRDATAAIDQPAGPQRVTGVLKQGDKENKYGFNDVASGRYVWLDLASLAQSTQSSPVLVVAAIEGGGAAKQWPRERPLSSLMNFYVEPNTHLVYAATWASLTVAGAFITFKRFLR